MTMSMEKKLYLQEQKLLHRKKNPLAKDYALSDWLVACDHAKDQGLGLEEDEVLLSRVIDHRELPVPNLAYFRWLAPEVVKGISLQVPSRWIRMSAPTPSGYRELFVFRSATVLEILDFLNLRRKDKDCYWAWLHQVHPSHYQEKKEMV